MRWIIWGAAAVIVLGASGPASAQMGGMMFDPGPSAKAAKAAKPAKPAPRAKRYYYRSGVGGTCGQYKYWTKAGCKDARTSPPSLK
jgi:hypothetical protein